MEGVDRACSELLNLVDGIKGLLAFASPTIEIPLSLYHSGLFGDQSLFLKQGCRKLAAA